MARREQSREHVVAGGAFFPALSDQLEEEGIAAPQPVLHAGPGPEPERLATGQRQYRKQVRVGVERLDQGVAQEVVLPAGAESEDGTHDDLERQLLELRIHLDRAADRPGGDLVLSGLDHQPFEPPQSLALEGGRQHPAQLQVLVPVELY